MSETLIQNFEARLEGSGCHPGSASYRVVVEFENDISEVLPYLNAELEQPTDYRHKEGVLLWKYRDKAYAFRPKEIAITPVLDNDEGQKLAENIIETVNNIWERRDKITPSFEGKKPVPRLFDILKLLPGSNCKQCGFPTCMAFAAELRMDFSKSSLCPDLSEKDFEKAVS
jgi:ArsR family metal-binding transcriptional regulator